MADEGLPPVLYEDKIIIRLEQDNVVTNLTVDNPLANFPFQTLPPGFADRKNVGVSYDESLL